MAVATCLLGMAALAPPVGATNFAASQNASLQLGSTSFTSTNRGPNMARGFDRPYGVQLDANGRVLVGDFGNNRLAVFNSLPSTDGAPIDLVVRNASKTDYAGSCTATRGRSISGGWSAGGKLAVVESVDSSASGWNSRVALYNTMPTADGAAADVVLGQTSLDACGAGATSASTLNRPSAVWTNGTRIIVADRDNHRVLIWNSWPTTNGAPADVVLGQASMTAAALDDGVESASTLERPLGVWSDGSRVAVADTFNNRVLVWNTWPTTNGQAASLVIGQPDAATTTTACSASKMWAPKAIASNGTRLAISDAYSRVLIYDSFPASSGAAANRVLGQANATTCAGRNAGATTALTASSLALPYGVATDGTRLLVADRLNHRVLAWNTWPTVDNAAANRVLGHTTFSAAGQNDAGLHTLLDFSFYSGVSASIVDDPVEVPNGGAWPAITPGGELLVSDAAGSRLDRYGGMPTVHDQAPTMRFGQYSDDQAFCNGTNNVLRAESLCYPMGTWTDGTKLAIADTANHRVKLWNTFPTTRDQPPDLVLGQASFTTRASATGASGMYSPAGVASDGTRLFVVDTNNHRVLVWSSWPTTMGQAADLVLGQPDFASRAVNNGGRSAATFNEPIGASVDDGRLAVADQGNHRVLIWTSLPTTQRQAANALYGQSSFADAATTNLEFPRGIALSDNALFLTARCDAQALDPVPTGIVASGATPIGRGCSSLSPSQNNVWVPTGIAVRRGTVWMGNDGNARMTRFDDVTAPTITRGPAHSIRSGCSSTARISWTTSESGTTELHWGPATAASWNGYPNSSVDTDITGLLHQRTLSSLASGTYYYRVRTVDAAGNEVVSTERSFVVGGSVPANDLFANRTSVASGGGTLSSSTVGACGETGEPQHAGVPGGASVWYTWTAPSNGRWVLDTLGSDFDTTLGIYTGTAVGSLTTVASNDDAGPSTRQSRVGFNAVSGTTYQVAIDGWYGDSGALALAWRLVANDAFSSPIELTSTRDTESGSTVGATKETGEPNHGGNAGGSSIWYTWTAPTTGSVTIDTFGSNFDTLLAAYTGTAVGSLTLVAGNDDAAGGYQSSITFNATMGTTYRIAVDGWGGATGDVTINLVQAPTLTGASPASGPQSRRSLVVQLTGTAFTSSTTVSFSGTGITVTAVNYVSPTRIDATIDIAADATLGARDVTVANPNSSTASSLFSVTTPSITLGLSTLGFTDNARDTTAPYALSFGTLSENTTRDIGPSGSGQTLAGPAVRVDITSDTHTQLQVSATAWSDGTSTMPVERMSWKHFSVTEAWTAMSTTSTATDTMIAPGTSAREHDLRLQVPSLQPAGSYSATMTYTLIAQP